MKSLALNQDNLDVALHDAVAVLRQGGIVAYPTETFYGLGVKFDLPRSLEELYELKRRPRDKAMPVIIGDRNMLSRLVPADWLANIPRRVRSLIETFWPGPLTVLMPAHPVLSELLTGRTGKIAVRMPGKSFALTLVQRAAFPITATSANLSGMPPARDAPRVTEYLNACLDLLIDGGPTPGGLPSTIIDVTGKEILIVREGATASRGIRSLLEER